MKVEMANNMRKPSSDPAPIERIRTPANQIIDGLKRELKVKQPSPVVPGVKLLLTPKAKPIAPKGMKFQSQYH